MRQNEIAQLYLNGQGTKKNLDESIRYFKMALECNEPEIVCRAIQNIKNSIKNSKLISEGLALILPPDENFVTNSSTNGTSVSVLQGVSVAFYPKK